MMHLKIDYFPALIVKESSSCSVYHHRETEETWLAAICTILVSVSQSALRLQPHTHTHIHTLTHSHPASRSCPVLPPPLCCSSETTETKQKQRNCIIIFISYSSPRVKDAQSQMCKGLMTSQTQQHGLLARDQLRPPPISEGLSTEVD